MELEVLKKRIFDFAKKRSEAAGAEMTAETSYIHLTEEMGEIARQIFNKKLRPDMFDEENMKEEIVDVILESLILAEICGVDLEKEIDKKVEALYKKHGFSQPTLK